MSKIKKSKVGTHTAATKKTQVSVVDNTSKPLTPEELTFVAQVITGFLETDVSRFIAHYDFDGEPYFYVDKLKEICVGNDRVLTIDLLSCDLKYELEDCFMLARNVPEYIRTGSPSPQVAEVLVTWFNKFYVPRVTKLLGIISKLQADTDTWEWLQNEARRVRTTAYGEPFDR